MHQLGDKIVKHTKAHIRKVAKKLFKDEGVDYDFRFNRRLKAYGTCSYTKKVIFLSEYYIHRPLNEVKRTILHEIAHYKAVKFHGAYGHGKEFTLEFKKMLKKYGVTEEDSGVKPNITPKAYLICTADKKVKAYKKYFRKPSKASHAKAERSYLKGRRKETKGKLKIVSHTEFIELIADEYVKEKEKV